MLAGGTGASRSVSSASAHGAAWKPPWSSLPPRRSAGSRRRVDLDPEEVVSWWPRRAGCRRPVAGSAARTGPGSAGQPRAPAVSAGNARRPPPAREQARRCDLDCEGLPVAPDRAERERRDNEARVEQLAQVRQASAAAASVAAFGSSAAARRRRSIGGGGASARLARAARPSPRASSPSRET